MIGKALFSTVGLALIVGWGGYTISSPDMCERVNRSAAPVRGSFNLARDLGRNWLDVDSRLTLIGWSISANNSTKSIIGHTFYGDKYDLQCGKGN